MTLIGEKRQKEEINNRERIVGIGLNSSKARVVVSPRIGVGVRAFKYYGP